MAVDKRWVDSSSLQPTQEETEVTITKTGDLVHTTDSACITNRCHKIVPETGRIIRTIRRRLVVLNELLEDARQQGHVHHAAGIVQLVDQESERAAVLHRACVENRDMHDGRVWHRYTK